MAYEEKSIATGLILHWRNGSSTPSKQHREDLENFIASTGIDWDTPYSDWKPAAREKLLRGDGKQFLGLLILLEKEFATATKPADQERLAAFRGPVTCQVCGGARLRPEARHVRLGEKAIHEVSALTIQAAQQFFADLNTQYGLSSSEPFASSSLLTEKSRSEGNEREETADNEELPIN